MTRRRTACANLSLCMQVFVLPVNLILRPISCHAKHVDNVMRMFSQCRTMTRGKMTTRRRTACANLSLCMQVFVLPVNLILSPA